MCGNCRAIMAGTFVIGTVVGAVASHIFMKNKLQAAFDEQLESSRAAAKRVIKNLRDKLKELEKVTVEEETDTQIDGQETFEGYLEMVDELYGDEKPKTESEKIPEGKNEDEIYDPDTVDFYYVKEINKWFNDEGDPLTEAEMKDILTEDGLKEAYANATVTSWTVVRGYLIVFKTPLGELP